jgi:hypothetical protein
MTLTDARVGPTHRRVPQPGRARNRPGATSKLAEALQAVLDAQGGDQAEIREIIARLDRMAAEVARYAVNPFLGINKKS